MKYSVIDIGSNSMRLTVYRTADGEFEPLFKEKKMTGLAGYVKDGCISERGISRACEAILEFRKTLESLGITEGIYVFATASLRNIVNTDEAASKISQAVGFDIDIITGEEEALLGYLGAMKETEVSSGAFVDIGGASTEITLFSDNKATLSKSYRIGSLKLYKDFVKDIIPEKNSVKRINKAVNDEFLRQPIVRNAACRDLICTGGTARALLKFARYLELVKPESNTMTAKQLYRLEKILLGDRKKAADIILKVTPERIHTIIPGLLIMLYIVRRLDVKTLAVSNYGVREGYLCQKVLK